MRHGPDAQSRLSQLEAAISVVSASTPQAPRCAKEVAPKAEANNPRSRSAADAKRRLRRSAPGRGSVCGRMYTIPEEALPSQSVGETTRKRLSPETVS